MAKQFEVGDKVFAKIRGYPPWPARINQIDDLSGKIKYHVVYYGTFETSVCKVGDLFLYSEFKNIFGKPSKRKSYMEGLSQIEMDEDLVPRSTSIKSEPQDRRVASKRKRESCDNSPQKKYPMQDKQNFHSCKKLKSDSNCTTVSPPVVTRSGRKVKPRKFSDDSSDKSLNDTGEADAQASFNSDGTPRHQKIDIPNAKKQVSFLNKKEVGKIQTVSTPSNSGRKLVKSVNDGEQLEEGNEEGSAEERRQKSIHEKFTWFKIEAYLLELESGIRRSLALERADIEKTLQNMHSFYALNIQPIMLKKYPRVIHTVLKMRRYVGNPREWDGSEEQRRKFEENAKRIRHAAEVLLDKFKNLLGISEGNVLKALRKILNEFVVKTRSLSHTEFCALMYDPTAGNSAFFPKDMFCEESLSSVILGVRE